MDKSAFYKICHEKERIAYLLLEIFNIRRSIMHPEKAEEYFKFKWPLCFSYPPTCREECLLVVHPKNRFHNLGNLHGNSWSDEDDNEMVDTEPIKNNISPKIYDQRTPLKKSKGMYNTEIVLSSDFSNKTEGISKSNRTITTSSFHTSFMIQQTCIWTLFGSISCGRYSWWSKHTC